MITIKAMPLTIMITGGSGFVGASLAIYLKRSMQSARVIALDNLKRRGSELNLVRLQQGGVEFLHADIRLISDVDVVDSLDIIIDCAAEPSVLAGYNESPKYIVDTNLGGTINCLEIARQHSAQFIFVSTSRVYSTSRLQKILLKESDTRFEIVSNQLEAGVTGDGINENFSVAGARSMYGASKFASEILVTEYADMYDMHTVINRSGVIAGPWQMGKFDQGIIGFWVAQHYFQGALKYLGFNGTGKQVRDILHIADFCRLIELQIEHASHVRGQTFNVGGGLDNAVSLLELTTLCQKATGKNISIDSIAAQRPGDVPIYVTDNRNVYEHLGWKPEIALEKIIADVVEWCDTNEEILQPVLGI